MTELARFPVDDVTLDLIEHALGASLCFDSGDPEVVGADMTLSDLLRFLSGYDPSKARLVAEGDPGIPGIGGAEVWEYPDPVYSEHDVIQALLDEVRRLRADTEDGE